MKIFKEVDLWLLEMEQALKVWAHEPEEARDFVPGLNYRDTKIEPTDLDLMDGAGETGLAKDFAELPVCLNQIKIKIDTKEVIYGLW